MATESNTPVSSEQSVVQDLLEELTAERFRSWYRERQYRKNIENGTPYFNGGRSVPEPERHSPSQLLQCHRKILYRQHNAPAEQSDPAGIFWFGSRFEEDIVFPFLERAITGPDTYVRNSEWVDFTVETDAGELQIKGATDPIIVDHDAIPLLPTEIKTKESVKSLTSPNRHHKAQLHAYMVGLSEKFDLEVTDAVLLYGSRKSLDVEVFHVTFDETFWQSTVLDWTSDHSQYRIDEELPPASPEYDWECKFCDYRERCGKGNTETDGLGPIGLVPLYDGYPRDSLVEYLDAHQAAQLTPTLAQTFPELAEKHDVADWKCESCSQSIQWDAIDWEADSDGAPVCPHCANNGTLATLQGPIPDQQQDTSPGCENA